MADELDRLAHVVVRFVQETRDRGDAFNPPDLVRAILTAMREPTPVVLSGMAHKNDNRDRWIGAIDHILNGETQHG